MAFLRLLLHQPELAILDEATTALDTATEAILYRTLQKQAATYVSVGEHYYFLCAYAKESALAVQTLDAALGIAGHRKELNAFHSHVLQHAGGWEWNFMSMQDYQTQRVV